MSVPPPTPPKLPDVLEQLKAVKSEATELRNFTITFLSLLLYINLIIAGTNAEQILRIAPVTLPLLNVPLPIIGFYGFVPWLLLLFHLYLLVQHYLFSQQLFLFKKTLDDSLITNEIHEHVRKNLGNLPFLHWMIGKHHSAMQFVLTLITLVCLLIWPLATLLWLQMAILPYHDPDLIWWQRATIIFDVLLIGWLWPKTLDSKDSSRIWWWNGVCGAWHYLAFLARYLLWMIDRVSTFWNPLLPRVVTIVLLALLSWAVIMLPNFWQYYLAFVPFFLSWLIYRCSVFWHWAVIPPSSLWRTITVEAALPKAINASTLALGLFATLFLSLAVATLPDSSEEKFITDDVNSKATKPADSLWLKTVDVRNSYDKIITARMAFMPTAWLHEQHTNIFENKKEYEEWLAKGDKSCPNLEKSADNSQQSQQILCLMVQPLLPRNLILREKVLTDDPQLKPELEAKLQAGVSELSSEVNAASEQTKVKQTMSDVLAQIRGLDLQNRNFDYADFTESSLPKADLRYASLKHAVLVKARLDQVRLNSAHLDQVNLSDAQLSDADMFSAQLPSADMFSAQLSGADMSHAQLSGADLSHAQLSGADLSHAQLSGVDLSYAQLSGVNLYLAQLSSADLSRAQLSGANLTSVQLSGAKLINAQLSGANLTSAQLSGVDLSYAQLSGVNLYLAQLSGADLSRAQLPGSELQIDTTPLSKDELMLTTDQYRNSLILNSDYQDNQKELEEKVKQFENKVKQTPDFSKAEKLTPCIRRADAKELLPDCISENALDEKTRKELTDVWVRLACDDKTEGHLVAQLMVERVDSYSWFAKPLLQAAQDPKTCPGLVGLSDDYKASLQAVVTEEAQKPAGN